MSVIKVVLRKKPAKDGSLPLCLRVWKDDKASYIYLGYHLHEAHWDKAAQCVKKSHPDHVLLNKFILEKRAEAASEAFAIEKKKVTASARTVRESIQPLPGEKFFVVAQDYLNQLKDGGKYNRYTADKPRISHFKEFLKGKDIDFADISVGLLERFVVYLKSSHKPKGKTKKRISDRTIANHLVLIRSIFAHARRNNVIDEKLSPFGRGKMQIRFPDSNKIGLTYEEVQRLEQLELTDATHDHVRNLWLFSFYLAGMRVSDIFRLFWSDIKDGRLHYRMGKNGKGGSVKVPDKALHILDKYSKFKENKDDLIFPELRGINLTDDFRTQKVIAFKTSAINKVLRNHVAPAAQIDKKLTMHIARHTFGNLAGKKVPLQMLQLLYRHSSITTTMIYMQNFIHEDADEAVDAVINGNFVKPSPS